MKNNQSSSPAKKRYCKMCGNLVDPTTKKCSSCGKQYLRPNLIKSILMWMLVIFLLGILFYNYFQSKLYKQQILELEEHILQLESNLVSITNEKNNIYEQYKIKFAEAFDLAQDYKDLRKTYAICEDAVVVVNSVDEWHMYHKCECTWAQLSAGTKTVYLKQTAILMGYKPCDCIDKPYKN